MLTLSATLLGASTLAAAQQSSDAGFPVEATPAPTEDIKVDPGVLRERPVFAADQDLSQGTTQPLPTWLQDLPKPQIADDAQRRFRIDRVLYDSTAQPGRVLTRGGHWKAFFGPEGMTYIPHLGQNAPWNQPTSFELRGVSVGGEDLSIRGGVVATGADGSVTIDRGSLREVYHLDLEIVEQTFVFDDLPGSGDLVIDIAVASSWPVIAGEDAIRFVSPLYGQVTYGRAYAVDATGATIEISREWNGSGIELRVPSSFLAGAVLPLTIDPPIGSTFSNGFGTTDDDLRPDIAYDSNSGQYWCVWEDYTSATDVDCFVSMFTASGTQGTTLTVDVSGDNWATPSIAMAPGSERALVVASVTPTPGSVNANIVGRLFDTTAIAAAGTPFVIDTQSQDCVAPDVGGMWFTGTGQAEFCVAWERIFSATDHDILFRLVDADGTFGTSTTFLSNSGANNDFAPAVSKSWGDWMLQGDFWNIAWIRDDDGNGIGTPIANRIYLDGSANGSSEFTVFSTNFASNIDVTGTFNDALPGGSDRPFVVAYQRAVSGNDIYATVCTQNTAHGTSSISSMEDFDRSLAQIEPSIASDGTSFFLTYAELYYFTGGTTDYDMYMLSGGISKGSSGGFIALAERHENLSFTGAPERMGAVCSQFDGGTDNDDGMVVWEDRNGVNGSTLRFRLLDIDTLVGSSRQSIGRQYCVANAHFDSGAGGRESSFMYILGDQSVGSGQVLYCEEMKLNAFGYFICSQSSGNVNMPGGSQGRLCLGSNIGRAVGGVIANSGTGGRVSALFNPLVLPTPTGPTSASPGQTWYFQCWHRDVSGGSATSNFSNACALTFLP